MNWFSCAPLATLEMSSNLYVAAEVRFTDLYYEGAHKKTTRYYPVSCRSAWQATAASLIVIRLLLFLYIYITLNPKGQR